MPRVFGSSSTVHRYFQKWVASGVFAELWRLALEEYDDLRGIKWDHQSIDSTSLKAPLGGEKTGPNPTDRGKLGTKRSVLVDGRGVPIGLELAGANVNDSKLTFETIDSIPIERPKTAIRKRQHFHADKGYDQKKRECGSACVGTSQKSAGSVAETDAVGQSRAKIFTDGGSKQRTRGRINSEG